MTGTTPPRVTGPDPDPGLGSSGDPRATRAREFLAEHPGRDVGTMQQAELAGLLAEALSVLRGVADLVADYEMDVSLDDGTAVLAHGGLALSTGDAAIVLTALRATAKVRHAERAAELLGRLSGTGGEARSSGGRRHRRPAGPGSV